MNEEIVALKAEIAALTQVMSDAAKQDRGAEVKELSEKLAALQADVQDRKVRFADGSKTAATGISKEAERKLDELFIASALLTRKDGRIDADAIAAVKEAPEYRDVVKDAGLTQGTGSSQNTGDAVGGDFIPTGFSSTLLEEIWLKLEIANLFKRFNMTNSTFNFPFAPDRLTARKGTEAAAVTKDRFATDQIIFTAKKIMANVDFTDEVEQDSIIAILPLVRAKLIESFAIGQEQICLNGDTTAGASNVNGNLSGTNAEDIRLTVNGLRKSGLASNCYSLASGGLSADNLRLLRTKMGKYGKNPADLCYIVSMQDYNKILGFANYQTLYMYGPNAVIQTGELGRIDGIPVIVTELLPSSDGTATTGVDSTGIVHGTAANNVKNICALVNKNAYMWGDRKAFGLETFRNPYNGMTSLIGSQRLDFQKILAASDPTVVFGINY